ncbi:MAG: hypothetical protein M2R45_00286 [Verrucomicrobia subdivision 3 bacterium]|nr:hypothetical protein [Limisphaerales bacterium]MCS1412954.1 hypothetical protein [Limisphaerales bacterium]
MEATNSALVVPSTEDQSTLSDIHDIRSVVDLPSSWAGLWWVLLVLAVLALAYWAYRYWKKRQQETPKEKAQPKESPHELARKRLETALEHLHDPERFCVMVSDAIRGYLEDRFDLHAPERTTEEFLEELRGSRHLSDEHKQLLANFLNECDLVKFAKSEPEAYELKQLHRAAFRLVSETEPSLMESPTPEPQPTAQADPRQPTNQPQEPQ